MNIGIKPISKDTFNHKVKIRFKNILDGFNNYKYKNLIGSNIIDFKSNEREFIRFLEEAYKLNESKVKNKTICYIDFYLKDLSDAEYNKLLEGLDREDRDLLNRIRSVFMSNPPITTEYFEVNDISIIPLLTKMCTRELFFITFYFTELPLTIWGNFNLIFPIFFEDENVLNKYIDIADSCNLIIK